MRTIYLRKENNNETRKVLLDMAYLIAHKTIRLPKYKFEEGLYLLHKSKNEDSVNKFLLTKDEISGEDNDFYYFKFPFKAEEVEDYAD